ncbi:major Facilitator Superfamily protein, partial [Vibrio cholerae CP1037(10)]|jgi:hypothetical protein
MGKI